MSRARIYGLTYHGITDGNAPVVPYRRRSYDVTRQAFGRHLVAMADVVTTPPSTSLGASDTSLGWAITFDDGAENGLQAADLLESVGWRGYFFVVSSRIGERGFLDRRQLCDLRDRGHVVGSHSATHPDRMSALPYEEAANEWRDSLECIGEAIGQAVDVAALPGGAYSREVAAAAAGAGVRVLFTSEPVLRSRDVCGCAVVGRYAVRSTTDADTVAALAAGRFLACSLQWTGWNSRKVAKRLLGDYYFAVRSRLLRGE